MILSRCPVLHEYWDRDVEAYNPEIAKLFSRHRCVAILTNLHFADRSTDFPTDEDGLLCEKCPVDQHDWDIRGFKDLLTTAWCA